MKKEYIDSVLEKINKSDSLPSISSNPAIKSNSVLMNYAHGEEAKDKIALNMKSNKWVCCLSGRCIWEWTYLSFNIFEFRQNIQRKSISLTSC